MSRRVIIKSIQRMLNDTARLSHNEKEVVKKWLKTASLRGKKIFRNVLMYDLDGCPCTTPERPKYCSEASDCLHCVLYMLGVLDSVVSEFDEDEIDALIAEDDLIAEQESSEDPLFICPRCGERALLWNYVFPGFMGRCLNCAYSDEDIDPDYDYDLG